MTLGERVLLENEHIFVEAFTKLRNIWGATDALIIENQHVSEVNTLLRTLNNGEDVFLSNIRDTFSDSRASDLTYVCRRHFWSKVLDVSSDTNKGVITRKARKWYNRL